MRIRKIHDKGYEEGSGTVKDVGYKGTAVPAAAALAAAVLLCSTLALAGQGMIKFCVVFFELNGEYAAYASEVVA